uniref:Carboxylesterase type B domain-containing protein n=1 Tax=Timema tahoe TaxID=61484 RepID=A0A7R9NXG6_9NEOP|nr:unnamed protein product [Timema tahoe]
MEDTVTVKLSQGVLRGRKVVSLSGTGYYSFQGVPYAKPPVGPLRFKAPERADPWEGVRDALTTGSVCTQYNIFQKRMEGDEDCLFLNVYSPQDIHSSYISNLALASNMPVTTTALLSRTPPPRTLPIRLPPTKAPRAVMVWIHGGGYVWGSGNTDLYGPDYLVDAGVILVTINYRLGVLGNKLLTVANTHPCGLAEKGVSFVCSLPMIGNSGLETPAGCPEVGLSLKHFHPSNNRPRGVVVSAPGYEARGLGFHSQLVPWVSFH